ncbi:S41 family peptidase [Flavobacteriaceae bacterium TK19130]|nr:S41 family peptidase [Thermobacterium salinum]
MKKKLVLLLLIVSTLFASCFEDNDDTIASASTQDIQDFIYRGLNFFYLYKSDTPELANDAFANETEKNDFLSSFETPESLFDYLKSDQDRFSILVPDYIELENSLNGISLSNGMEFGLVFEPNSDTNLFGYVRYVLPNTDAEAKNVMRGMIFTTVDGEQLTVNNRVELLSRDSYTIGLANYDGNTLTPTGETIALTKQQYTENPVFKAETLTVDGIKVGYLMYNSFTRDFDSELNAAFAQFQAEGVTELVLDLRYNGGGAVETAVDLCSMITGQFNGDILYTEEWNADRQQQYAEPGVFDSSISNGEAINSLQLMNLYVIATRNTASASELVINGLNPYINVTQVGTNTRGKYQASFILYDAPAPNFSRSEANPGHTYAMLPLVFKTANSLGNTDYDDGLEPDFGIGEDYANLGTLGSPNEPLLEAALGIITGRRPSISQPSYLTELEGRKSLLPDYQIMWAEK